MQPADVLYNMAQSVLRKNAQAMGAFQQSMAARKSQQEALHAQVAAKNTRKPTAEERKAEEDRNRAEAVWGETGAFGKAEAEESEEPVTRVVREDPDVRSFPLVRDVDETAEPVVRKGASERGDWGSSMRTFGSYEEE